MKRFLTLFAVVMMSLLAFNTAQADSREDLISAVKAFNDECPKGDDDTVLKSVKVDGDNLVFTFVMSSVSKAELDMLKTVEGDIINAMVANFHSDKDIKNVLDLCKSAKCNLVLRFSNSQGQYVDLTLPNSKI